MIKNFLRNFMVGRYGPDHLNIVMIVVSLLLSLVSGIFKYGPLKYLAYISYAILALALFRMLSRNIPRRRAENDKFIRYWWPIRTKFVRAITGIKNRKTHKFFKCPSCHNTLRVPKKKCRLQITCPQCGERFIKKT